MDTYYIALGMLTVFAPVAVIVAIAYTLIGESRADRRDAAALARKSGQ